MPDIFINKYKGNNISAQKHHINNPLVQFHQKYKNADYFHDPEKSSIADSENYTVISRNANQKSTTCN